MPLRLEAAILSRLSIFVNSTELGRGRRLRRRIPCCPRAWAGSAAAALRDRLLEMAREWMRVVMHEEKDTRVEPLRR
jgi:hypothetical protein